MSILNGNGLKRFKNSKDLKFNKNNLWSKRRKANKNKVGDFSKSL